MNVNGIYPMIKGKEAESVAQELNDELEQICEESNGRLFGFATLPVRNPKAALKEIERCSKNLKNIKGFFQFDNKLDCLSM